MLAPKNIDLHGVQLRVRGTLLRTASLRDEYYVPAPEPGPLIDELRRQRTGADLYTFVQGLQAGEPRHAYAVSFDQMAVLPVSTYAHWFDRQLTFKPRNRVRKAWKSGVSTQVVAFDDMFVRNIMQIYDESPLRQGKRNRHYGKSFEVVRSEHSTFLNCSEFIGAYFRGEMIGFAKITHIEHGSILMNIVARLAHRDRSPMNALMAGAVERVAAHGSPLLNYGIWGRRGLNTFKVASGFQCLQVPRYHVPLTWRGQLALESGLHRGLKERLPEEWIVRLADARARWNAWQLRCMQRLTGSPAAVPVSGAADD